MIEVSVIICSHNLRPDYFKRALGSLRGQAFAQEKWELSLVDNTSQKPLSRESDLSWQNNARLLLGSELGLAPARRAGMCATAADLLVSVDDGNVLDLRYLKEALRIKNGRPDLGVWGSGAIVPKFERQPSAHVEVLLSYLALQEPRSRDGDNSSLASMSHHGVQACAASVRGLIAESEYLREADAKGEKLPMRKDSHVYSARAKKSKKCNLDPRVRARDVRRCPR